MNIKDFTVGQTAFVYSVGRRNNPEKGYREVTVKKVGRAYVTLDNGWESKYGVGYGCGSYLVEKVDAGTPSYLFRTKRDLDDYLEAERLRSELQQAMNWANVKKLPLSTLRAIKKILEDGEEST